MKIIKLKTAVVIGHNAGIGRRITGHTTGLESTKSKLGTGLTNGLSGNHTDSLTLLNHAGSGQVTAVTLHTYAIDRKSTRLNSSHANISYAVFCLKKKTHK